MAGTYWLTILPETSKLRPGIAAAMRGMAYEVPVDPDVNKRRANTEGKDYGGKFHRGFRTEKIKPNVDTSKAGAEGRDYGARFARGFRTATRRISAPILGIGAAVRLVSASLAPLNRTIGRIGISLTLAAFFARRFATATMFGASGLQLMAGVSLVRLSNGLSNVANVAQSVAKQVSRISAALLTLRAAITTVMVMQTFAKIAAIVTLGGVALLGVTSALLVVMGQPLVFAFEAAGAAMGVFAGAAVGLLGPALVAAKMGFTGLGEAAKSFNKQFKDLDETFYKMVGERMGPMLTSMRDLRVAVTDTFSAAMGPAFESFGTFIDGMKPRLAGLSTTMAGLFGSLAATLSSPAVSTAFDKMFAASSRFFQSFTGGGGLSTLVTGLVQFAATAADTFAQLGGQFDKTLGRFGEWLGSITPMQMVIAFRAVGQVIENIGAVIKPIFNLIKDVGQIAAPALAPGFAAIGEALSQARPGVIEMTKILMPTLSRVLENLAPMIPGLVRAFMPWATVLSVVAPALAAVVTALAPFAPQILATVIAVKALVAIAAVYKTAMLAWTVATKGAAGAVKMLNLSLLANPIVLIIAAVVALGVALWAFFTKTETGRKLWDKIWNGIKTVAGAVWEWLKSAIAVVGEKILWLWATVVKPAFDGISNVISAAWTIIKVLFEAWIDTLQWVGDKVLWLWNQAMGPAIGAIGDLLASWWEGAKAVWDKFIEILDKVADKIEDFKTLIVKAFTVVRDTIVAVWNKVGGIIDKIGNGLGAVGNFIKGAGSVIVNTLGIDIDGGAAGGRVVSRYADGGRIAGGPGTATSDSILGFPAMVRVSNGEFIVNAAATRRWLPLLTAINSGSLPGFSEGGLPASSKAPEGGLQGNAVLLARLLGHMFPQIASMGGFRADGGGYTDHPEGRALDIMIPNYTSEGGIALGDTITAFLMANSDKLGVEYTIWRQTYRSASGASNVMGSRGSDTADHYDHVHVTTKAGAPADYSPPSGLKLPGGALNASSMDGMSIGGAGTELGEDGNLYTYRTATSDELSTSGRKVQSAQTAVRNAEQRIDDLNYDVGKAERRIQELAAEGKSTADAEEQLRRKMRELADATELAAQKRERLNELEQDDAELREKGKRVKAKSSTLKGLGGEAGGGSDASSLGQTFVSGILESIGLDGSIFSNPLEWPTVKSAMAGVNWLGGLLSGGEATATAGGGSVGGFAGGAADAVGLGGLLSAIPSISDSADMAGVSGSPALAPGGFNPAIPGGMAAASSPGSTMSAFAPHQGGGQSPGPAIDNSININGPVGQDGTSLRAELRAEQAARTRTTKVY